MSAFTFGTYVLFEGLTAAVQAFGATSIGVVPLVGAGVAYGAYKGYQRFYKTAEDEDQPKSDT